MKPQWGILGLVLLLALGANGGGCGNGVVGVQEYGAITGRVLDATTNRPIAGALVSVGSLYTAYADADGAFTLPSVPAGEQTVTARSPGYQTASKTLEIHKDVTANVDYIRLAPSGSSVPTIAPPATATPAPQPTPSAAPSASPARAAG